MATAPPKASEKKGDGKESTSSRRTDKAKAAKRAPKRKSAKQEQKELFNPRVPAHDEITKLAQELKDAQIQRDAWQGDCEQLETKLSAIGQKHGIKGKYKASDGIIVTFSTIPEKHKIKVKDNSED